MQNTKLATNIQVVIVEDETIIAEDLKECLENLGYSVAGIASSGEEAIQKVAEIRPNLVLMDIRLRGNIDGIEAAQQIWNSLEIPVVYITSNSNKSTVERAMTTAPFGYLLKPFAEEELYVAVETALQRYKLEAQLKQQKEWLDNILKSIGDAIIVTDTKCCIKFINPVAEVLTGWKHEDALDKNLAEVFKLINQERRTPAKDPVSEALEKGIIIYLPEQINLISKDGTELPITDSAAPIQDKSGNITGAVLLFRNSINRRSEGEQKLLEQAKQLESQMGELQRLNQIKDDWLNNVAHELRTPLTNIQTAIQMLTLVLDQQRVFSTEQEIIQSDSAAQPPLGDRAAQPLRVERYLQILRSQCEQELQLINDLLDLQQLDASANDLDQIPIVLHHWLAGVLEPFEERISYNQQSLQVNISPDLPPLITNLPSLKRIFTELLNNACKYTPVGEQITVTANAQANNIQIIISNTGIEISADELPRIFEKFYRSPNVTQLQEGSGLGLAIVKKLVEQLGGQISVTSQNNQTSFTLTFPQS